MPVTALTPLILTGRQEITGYLKEAGRVTLAQTAPKGEAALLGVGFNHANAPELVCKVIPRILDLVV